MDEEDSIEFSLFLLFVNLNVCAGPYLNFSCGWSVSVSVISVILDIGVSVS